MLFIYIHTFTIGFSLFVQAILSRGRTPIVVGGTGFYVNTLLSGESTAPASTAEDKQHVNQLIASKTWDQR